MVCRPEAIHLLECPPVEVLICNSFPHKAIHVSRQPLIMNAYIEIWLYSLQISCHTRWHRRRGTLKRIRAARLCL